jgi:hypothetical protein
MLFWQPSYIFQSVYVIMCLPVCLYVCMSGQNDHLYLAKIRLRADQFLIHFALKLHCTHVYCLIPPRPSSYAYLLHLYRPSSYACLLHLGPQATYACLLHLGHMYFRLPPAMDCVVGTCVLAHNNWWLIVLATEGLL